MTQKHCLVVGGTGAVGEAICRDLAAQGAKVSFTWHQNESKAQQLQNELAGAQGCRVDLFDAIEAQKSLRSFVHSFGKIDALVYSAAVGFTGNEPKFEKIDDVSVEQFERMFAVNVKGFFMAVQICRTALEASKGNIVVIGSIDGVKSVPSPIHYGASKGALRGMVLSLNKELGPKGVKTNMVVPGILSSGLSKTIPDDLKNEYLKHSSLKRLGRADEVAKWVSWLALENTYMTGQVPVLDGGL